MGGKYIGAIDEGTSSTRFILFDVDGKQVGSHQIPFKANTPKAGWCGADAAEILAAVEKTIEVTLAETKVAAADVVGIGITNQRETTVIWDKTTGKPLADALIWHDTRTRGLVDATIAMLGGNQDAFRAKTGLPITTYFSAMKIKWLMANSKPVAKAVKAGTALFGTIDSWLIWNLTGGPNGGVHVTDVTNASRTLLMDLASAAWDSEICSTLDIPMAILPKIASCSEVYGKVAAGPLAGVPVAGSVGDQQAALLGHLAIQPGSAKNTYGTGCFMLYNTGTLPVLSKSGLLTTVGFQLGPSAPVHYALEGSIAIAGAGVNWLRDNLGIIESAKDMDKLASSVPDNGGVYMVAAFGGLFAPHWRTDARGVIVGLTQHSTKAHIARAHLEGVAFRSAEILQAMKADAGVSLTSLAVDGGMSRSDFLLQTQADLLGIPVARPADVESTARGAAYAAGLAVGFWPSTDAIAAAAAKGATTYKPKIKETERSSRMAKWAKVITHTYDLADL